MEIESLSWNIPESSGPELAKAALPCGCLLWVWGGSVLIRIWLAGSGKEPGNIPFGEHGLEDTCSSQQAVSKAGNACSS